MVSADSGFLQATQQRVSDAGSMVFDWIRLWLAQFGSGFGREKLKLGQYLGVVGNLSLAGKIAGKTEI